MLGHKTEADTKIDDFNFDALDDSGVYVIGSGRSPIGSYGGSLSGLTAADVASRVIVGVMDKCSIDVADVSEVILGNVLQANSGQNPARIAAMKANIDVKVPCTTVNKVCASGMKAMMFAAQSLQLGHNSLVVCGGMESMSQCPYYLPQQRFGSRMGHKITVDGMIKDGLWDVYSDQHMGSCAELTARKMRIPRKAQDDFAISSFHKAQNANTDGLFNDEIIKIEILNKRKSTSSIISKDEGCDKLNEKKLRSLRGIFVNSKNSNIGNTGNTGNVDIGNITAGNSSQLSDGAAICVLCRGSYLKNKHTEQRQMQMQMQQNGNSAETQPSVPLPIPLFKIESYADASTNPVDFATAPSIAIPLALSRCNLSMNDLDFACDYIEINEAFSVAVLANCILLNIPPVAIQNNINVRGGAVAIGHPLGCSGARICVSLMSILNQKRARLGVAGICNGGGGASAIVIRRLQFNNVGFKTA